MVELEYKKSTLLNEDRNLMDEEDALEEEQKSDDSMGYGYENFESDGEKADSSARNEGNYSDY